MRRHLKRRLNNGELLKMGGSYEGSIAEVVEETVRNPFTTQQEVVPTIVFVDGWRLIPNIGMRRALVEMLGEETDHWVGRHIVISIRLVARQSANGETRERYEKIIESVDPDDQEAATATTGTEVEALTAADISWERER